jgi:hypothetical protein
LRSPLRWLVSNLSTLILSFALAVVVWISAVTAANPNIERIRTVPLEVIGLDPDKLVTSSVPAQVRVTLRAPTSVMDSITSTEQSVRAWVDVSGLEAGTHDIMSRRTGATASGRCDPVIERSYPPKRCRNMLVQRSGRRAAIDTERPDFLRTHQCDCTG